MSPCESRSGLPCDLLARGRVGIPRGVAADRVPRRGHLRRGRRDPRAPLRPVGSDVRAEPDPNAARRSSVVAMKAIEYTDYGSPDVLSVTEGERPTPGNRER